MKTGNRNTCSTPTATSDPTPKDDDTMNAKFAGSCGGCRSQIKPGDPIGNATVASGRYGKLRSVYMHSECAQRHELGRQEEAGEWFC